VQHCRCQERSPFDKRSGEAIHVGHVGDGLLRLRLAMTRLRAAVLISHIRLSVELFHSGIIFFMSELCCEVLRDRFSLYSSFCIRQPRLAAIFYNLGIRQRRDTTALLFFSCI
jgi:hypothetical protein